MSSQIKESGKSPDNIASKPRHADKNGARKAKGRENRRGNRRPPDLACLPCSQTHTESSYIIGLICRAFVAAVAVLGISLFICDSMAIITEAVSFYAVLIPSFIFTAVITAMTVNGYTFIFGCVALGGGVTVWIAAHSVELIDFIYGSIRIFINAIIDRIAFAGLAGLKQYSLSRDYSEFNSTDLMQTGVMLFVLLIAILFVPAIVKRVKLAYVLILGTLLCTPSFAYNIMRDNWGFAFVVSGLCGVLVLFLYDKLYTVPKQGKKLVSDFSVLSVATENATGINNNHNGDNAPDKSAGGSVETAETVRRKPSFLSRIFRRRGKDTDIEAALTLVSAKDKRAQKKKARIRRRDDAKAYKAMLRDEKKRSKLSKPAAQKNAALGGAAGVAATVIIFLTLLLPAAFVSESSTGIPGLDKVMERARIYVTAFLMGDDIDLNNISTIGGKSKNVGPRTTNLKYPKYSGSHVVTVEVPYNTPVYLRSWIGTDYKDDAWYSGTIDDVTDYHEYFGEDFTPEMITQSFYEAIYPNFDEFPFSSGYRNNLRYGFITEHVNITRESGQSSLLYMPSFAMPSLGILRYSSQEESFLQNRAYYDGVWTSKYFIEGVQYSTVSLVTTMKYPDIGRVLANSMKYYESMMEPIRSGEADTYIGNPEAEEYITGYEATLETEGIVYNDDSLLRRYIFNMTADERAELVASDKLSQQYKDYAKQNYIGVDHDDNEISDLAYAILNSAGCNYIGAADMTEHYHEMVLALIRYMSENCTYQIEEPEASETDETSSESGAETDAVTDDTATENEGGSDTEADSEAAEADAYTAIEEFLLGNKTGYCVQYASSLALMLRSMGIPARYCEGYIASEYSTLFHSNDNPLTRYKCKVLDSNAHAWVEVYFDDIGWVQYEATAPYLEGMYGSSMPTSNPADTPIDIQDTPEPPDVTEPEDPVELGDGSNLKEIIIKCLIISGIVIAAALVIGTVIYIVIFKRRADNARSEREKLIFMCTDEASNAALTDDELHDAAIRVNAGIFDVLYALGCEPAVGELSDEYAERINEKLGAVSQRKPREVLDYIAKEEFGHSITRSELSFVASYYKELCRSVYLGLGRKDKFRLRYVLRVV